MGDVPILPEPEAEPDPFAERLVALRDRLDDGVRVGLTADRAGSLRRPILFVLIGVALVLNLPAVGIVALLALALTDQVVAL